MHSWIYSHPWNIQKLRWSYCICGTSATCGSSPSQQTRSCVKGSSASHISAGNGENDSHLPLIWEDIPCLVQQVLQALPGATTHNNPVEDIPSLVQQVLNSGPSRHYYPQHTCGRFLTAQGKSLTRHHFSLALTDIPANIGLSIQDFNTHSFRIGAATSAKQANVSDTNIQMLGYWHSNTYKRYICMAPSELAKFSRTLASLHN